MNNTLEPKSFMTPSADHLYPLIKANLILLLLFLIFAGLYFSSAFLIPLAFAGILAMLMTPLCNKMEAMGIHKGVASFLCILVLILLFAGVGVLLSAQVASFSEDLPRIERQLTQQLNTVQQFIQENLGISPRKQEQAVKSSSGSGSGGTGSMIITLLGSFTTIMANSLLVLVYMFLLLFYRSRFPKFILKVVSKDRKEQARQIIHDSSQVAQQYLIGRGILILILAVLYSIGMTIIGLDNALFLSVLAALLSIVPYVGNILGVFIFLFMALAQGAGNTIYIGILTIFMFVQFFESYFLEPYVVGAEVDIHPFFTVVIIIIGELIWGIAGMILAIPILGIFKIIFSHIDYMEPYAYLIGDTRDKDGSSSFTKIKQWFKGEKTG